MMKINALIEEMNYKITENKMNFREELVRLKVDLVDPSSSKGRAVTRANQSIPMLPRTNKIHRHIDS